MNPTAFAYQKYNIVPGQVYIPATGSKGKLIVVDVETRKEQDDVLVFDEFQKKSYYIDAFKLAMVRYKLA